MCVNVLLACVCVYHVCDQCQQRSEEAMGSPATGVRGDYEPRCVPGTSLLLENTKAVSVMLDYTKS